MSGPTGPVADIDPSDDLRLARSVADRVGEFTLSRFVDRDFTVDWKENATEVTEVDRHAERLVVDGLLAARPDDAVFGEEHGLRGDESAERRWVIDPIDGTSGFVRGIPIWATLIALTVRDVPVLGVVSAPALATQWWGVPGWGAGMSAHGRTRELGVSRVDDLSDAQVSVTHSSGWDDLGLTPRLVEIQQRARRSRGMGDFWQHMLVAEGAVDVAIDAIGVAPYDLAAVRPIVEAAGGSFTDRHGEATHLHDSAVSTNGVLHAEIIERLRD